MVVRIEMCLLFQIDITGDFGDALMNVAPLIVPL